MYMPARPTFDRHLGEIRDDILRLSSMADLAIKTAVTALSERNCDLARRISADDEHLNAIRYSLEEKAYSAIATQQPAGHDLRYIVASISIATNLERIGDHAAGIARLVLRMCDQPLLKPLVDIPQMAEIARTMVKDSVKAYLQQDVKLAETVVARDIMVNELHQRVFNDLLAYMTRDPGTVERGTYLLWVSHGLERIGDRAKNICERAIYLTTGELKEFPDRVIHSIPPHSIP
jgi:phosphate transport system protein